MICLEFHGIQHAMKTTFDLPDAQVKEAMKYTGAKNRNEAVHKALADFNRRQRLKKLAAKLGTFENFMTIEELMKLRSMS